MLKLIARRLGALFFGAAIALGAYRRAYYH